MGEGKSEVAKSLLDLQPTAIIDLFLVYPDYKTKPDLFVPLHGGSVFKKGIIWQGTTYMPIPIEIDGFEVNADGRVNRPKFRVSNKDFFATDLLRNNSDFKNGKVIRKRTFVKFLDDENFDGGNPFGAANNSAELSNQEYVISQKTQENKIFVEFELTSPLDLETFEINSRKIYGKYCFWQYRGGGCQYKGIPIHQENGDAFRDINGDEIKFNTSINDYIYGNVNDLYDNEKQYTTGDLAFIVNEKVNIVNPYDNSRLPILNYFVAKTDVKGLRPDQNPKYWNKDGCNKKLSSCKLRFSESSTVSRFLETKEYNIPLTTSIGLNPGPQNTQGDVLFFRPLDESSIVNELNTSNWTLILSYKSIIKTEFGGFFESSASSNGLKFKQNNSDNQVVFKDGTSDKTINLSRRNYPIENYLVFITKRNKKIEVQVPSFREVKTYVSNSKLNITHNIFRVGAITINNQQQSALCSLESVVFIGSPLSDSQINNELYKTLSDGSIRIIRYEDIDFSQTWTNNIVGWWQNPYSDGVDKGIRDSHGTNDLVATLDPISHDIISSDTYSYDITEEIETKETTKFLPFGGFPGTDGFSFSRR